MRTVKKDKEITLKSREYELEPKDSGLISCLLLIKRANKKESFKEECKVKVRD